MSDLVRNLKDQFSSVASHSVSVLFLSQSGDALLRFIRKSHFLFLFVIICFLR